jgi:transposase
LIDHQQIAACDRRIEASLGTLAEPRARQPQPAPRPRQSKRKRNQPGFEVRGALHRMTGVDLTALEGIDDTTALMLVSEIGFAMSRWPTVKPFTSWLGWCPHQRVSGGKVRSRRTKWCAHRAATALRLAASCLHHRQSALGAFFRRMQARLGTPKAMTATAHTLARLVDTLLKHGTADVA